MTTGLNSASYTPIQKVAIKIATGFGIGNAPVAPGTFGSIPGLIIGVIVAKLTNAIWSEPTVQFSAVTFFMVIGIGIALWSIHVTENAWDSHDESSIVVDEVIGQAIAIGFADPNWKSILLAFALFRLLDITKPLVIGWIDESAPGAIGTLGDDLLAGLVTALLIGGLTLFFPSLLA